MATALPKRNRKLISGRPPEAPLRRLGEPAGEKN